MRRTPGITGCLWLIFLFASVASGATNQTPENVRLARHLLRGLADIDSTPANNPGMKGGLVAPFETVEPTDDVVRGLVEAYRRTSNSYSKQVLLNGLMKYGQEALLAVPDVCDGMTNQVPIVRLWAALVLGGVGSCAKITEPLLLKDVENANGDAKDRDVGVAALRTAESLVRLGEVDVGMAGLVRQIGRLPQDMDFLNGYGPLPDKAVPGVLLILKTAKGMRARQSAADLLRKWRPDVLRAETAELVRLWQQEGFGANSAYHDLLTEKSIDRAVAIPLLEAFLPKTNTLAVGLLGFMRPEADLVLQAAAKNESNKIVAKRAAAELRGYYTPERRSSVLETIANPAAETRERVGAILGLFHWRSFTETAVPVLRRAVEETNREVRVTAALLLYKFGDRNGFLAGNLFDVAFSEEFAMGWGRTRSDFAKDLVGRICEANEEDVVAFAEVIRRHPSYKARQAARDVIRRLDASVAPALRKAIAGADDSVKVHLARAIRDTQPALLVGVRNELAPVVAAAQKGLASGDYGDRWVAVESIGACGVAAKQAAPSVIAALGDPVWQVRAQAANALGCLGVASGEVKTALAKAAADPHECVQFQAIRAAKVLK